MISMVSIIDKYKQSQACYAYANTYVQILSNTIAQEMHVKYIE